jgi:hypothetical protein
MKVKSSETIKKNYTASAALVPERFRTGVSTASWKDAAQAGQGLYVQMLSDPSVLARRTKGIDRVSDDSWRTDTITKGAGVIGARMTAAADKQASRFAPYAAVLSGMTLADRTADPATNVANRVAPIAVALRAKKNEIG